MSNVSGFESILTMNTGAEAVETAIKAARRWGYFTKGIPENSAEIIVADGNFHGRTTTIVGFSSDDSYKKVLDLLQKVLSQQNIVGLNVILKNQ